MSEPQLDVRAIRKLEIATGQFGPDAAGAVWKLQLSRRHLDANIIHLQPGSRIQAQAGPGLDVLWHILHGDGQLLTDVGMLALRSWRACVAASPVQAGNRGRRGRVDLPDRPPATARNNHPAGAAAYVVALARLFGPVVTLSSVGVRLWRESPGGGTVATIAEVQVRRVYDEPEDNDGVRVLVDRIWPRGMTKARAALTEWCKDVAPSTELRKWYSHDPAKFEEFTRRYGAELEQVERAQALQHLRDLAADRRLTLLTAGKDVDISEATVLAAILNR